MIGLTTVFLFSDLAVIRTIAKLRPSTRTCPAGVQRLIISKRQFDGDVITLSGLPWCKEPKEVGLARLVAKNLCRVHNGRLSPADGEAKRLKDGPGTIGRSKILAVRMKLDARLIEQWLLRTTIDLALQTPDSGIDLGDEVVRRAFGLSMPPPAQGFFAVDERHETQAYSSALRSRHTFARLTDAS